MTVALLRPETGPIDLDRFVPFLQSRPKEEKWQLVDGVATLMSPATHVHGKIAQNLERLLNDGLERHRPDLWAIRELGVSVEGLDDFLAIPDVVVLDGDAKDALYVERFFLAVEILSNSNRPQAVAAKIVRYQACRTNLHCLVLEQDVFLARLWSRTTNWREETLSGPQARLVLPEFGLDVALADLYRRTPLVPHRA